MRGIELDKEHRNRRPEPLVRVNSIYSTIQGEGCLTGTPMVVIRLQGCNLRCPWCDTKETWDPDGGWLATAEAIVEHVKEAASGHRWVLVTGGEPLLQDLGQLTKALHTAGYKMAVETNGTQPLRGAIFNWVCISPKDDDKIRADVLCFASELKYVVENTVPEPPELHGPVLPEICLQPVSQDPEATKLCIKAVQERGWRLSVQLHKYLNLP